MWIITLFCLLVAVLCGPNYDFYNLLEVSRTSSIADIKKAYRKMSLKHHPDKSAPNDKAHAEEMFRKLTDAYSILTNPSKKRIYDIYGSDSHIDIDDMEDYHQHLDKFRVKDLYRNTPFVNILYSKNFDSLVGKKSPVVWVITFSHPDCSGCQRLVPIMSALAEKEKELAKKEGREVAVRVGAVNCAFDMRLCHRLGVSHFGTIFFFAPNQPGGGMFDSEQYQGPSHNWEQLHKAARSASVLPYEEFTSERSLREYLLRSKVTMRSPIVNGVDEIWLVDMWRPGCPPCLQVKASLRLLAKKFKGSIKVATINCAETNCSANYFPYIQMWVKKGSHIKVSTLNFDGGQHPATIAMNAVGNVVSELFELSRVENNKGGYSHTRDEL